MECRKIQPLICRHDLDGGGRVARLRHGDVGDLGHVCRRQGRSVPGGYHHADALRPHEGHAIGIALGCHQVFDLGFRQGVGSQSLNALGSLSGSALRRAFLCRRLPEKLNGAVPCLLPGEPGGGKVVRSGVNGVLPLRGGAVLFPADQRRLPQELLPASSPLTAPDTSSAGGENLQLMTTAAPTSTSTVSTTAFFRQLSFLMLFLLQMTIDI